ncbi:TNT domain-containing protein [Actinocrinis puniceicyclus]|uniref:TNT domain-containing protein n=1 Tax=Actinocrinis puniceicyclus TaxID=977794 RepID=A0A8J7WIX5_9ACTN|nr:TNT domain-containing protein [Actinocrinis puniceicyclus]MBS2963118.1 TNT domain-containing protein [Actinocrinis puniceicyclus]
MNLDELKLILQLLQVPDDVASVGRLRDDRFCLLPHDDGTYEVFWYERGGHHDDCTYDNLAAGCYGFLGKIGGGLQGLQLVRQGQGTQYSVGGAPLDHPAVQALFDATGADVYGGLGEAGWVERFVAPEDQGAPVGARRLIWPAQDEHPDGFASATGREPTRLAAGTVVDTFGPTFTRVLYDVATPFAARSLPVDYAASGYRRWRVLKDTAVWSGPVAPWFGQPGGGIQHFALMPVADLAGSGFVEEVDRTGVAVANPAIGDLFSEDIATNLYWRSHVGAPEGLVSQGRAKEQSWCFIEGKDGWWEVFFYEHGSRTEDLGRADSRQAALRVLGGRLLYTDIINRED